ncbi:hypothetical protein KOR42_16000 [Thalassoglobus neptunius]|uniref:Uncharacterized protein n=1 Tax=Thalassoglobus neptunius TaxID=1938619 RepID=A0A5C5X6F4_9PLAN|nr:hypothetical protein KOR42_16000 [Thalassoglobus neptunius]
MSTHTILGEKTRLLIGESVVVRAFGDRPVRLEVCDQVDGVVYLANPKNRSVVVGFLKMDVYSQVDDLTLKRLEAAHREQDTHKLNEEWQRVDEMRIPRAVRSAA